MTRPLNELAASVASSRVSQASLLGIVTLYLFSKLRENVNRRKIVSTFLNRIEVVKKEREESLKWARQQSKLISDEEREKIEKMDFTQLRDALQSISISCESVVRVYYGLALKSHEKTNCLTNIIKESLDVARELDEKAKDPSYKKGPLHGIPISIKESSELVGYRCTRGLAQNIDKWPKEDSYPVARLKEDGMIPFCQTNVPTSCFTYNCDNSIFGTTTNPHNSSRTSGGSSGGEGAILGSGGSIIGIGSDIGGSIRLPSAYSGCCGFKPSSTRFSTLIKPEPAPSRPFLMATEGPMARDPHAIVHIMRSIWSDFFISNKDALSVPIDFREDLFKEGRKYRIGYYTSDGCIEPLPGNQRVVREAVEIMRAQGHELVPFSLDSIAHDMLKGLMGSVFADGGSKLAEALKNEPLSPIQSLLRDNTQMPLWKKKLFGWLSALRGDSMTAEFLLNQPKTAMDVQRGIDGVFGSRKALVRKMKEEGIDVILCPPTLSPAMPHALPNQIPFTAIMPTLMWNGMDFPAGVVTTSSWTESDEKDLEKYEEKGMVESGIKRGCKGSVGLPLAVQFVAPPFRDEIVLRMMVDLYDGMKK